jgi:hypothetical protein
MHDWKGNERGTVAEVLPLGCGIEQAVSGRRTCALIGT